MPHVRVNITSVLCQGTVISQVTATCEGFVQLMDSDIAGLKVEVKDLEKILR